MVSKWPAITYTMIGTVMTRWVMTSAVSVLLRRRNWNTANSGIRNESAGVIRAIRMRTTRRFAPRRAMPKPAGTPISNANSVAPPETTMLFHRQRPIEFCSNTETKFARVGGFGMKTGGYVTLSISFLSESDSIHRKTRIGGDTITATDTRWSISSSRARTGGAAPWQAR